MNINIQIQTLIILSPDRNNNNRSWKILSVILHLLQPLRIILTLTSIFELWGLPVDLTFTQMDLWPALTIFSWGIIPGIIILFNE